MRSFTISIPNYYDPHQGNSYESGMTFAFINTSPRLPERPPAVIELGLALEEVELGDCEVAYLCTEGRMMKHS